MNYNPKNILFFFFLSIACYVAVVVVIVALAVVTFDGRICFPCFLSLLLYYEGKTGKNEWNSWKRTLYENRLCHILCKKKRSHILILFPYVTSTSWYRKHVYFRFSQILTIILMIFLRFFISHILLCGCLLSSSTFSSFQDIRSLSLRCCFVLFCWWHCSLSSRRLMFIIQGSEDGGANDVLLLLLKLIC